jgi:hypothetical protein
MSDKTFYNIWFAGMVLFPMIALAVLAARLVTE